MSAKEAAQKFCHFKITTSIIIKIFIQLIMVIIFHNLKINAAFRLFYCRHLMIDIM